MATIERPRSDDVDEIVSLWVELAEGQREFGSHLRAAENRAVIRSQITRCLTLGELLLARAGDSQGGDIVGFVMYGPDTGSFQQDVSRGTIHNVFVRDSHRDRGIGTSLLEAAEAELAQDGIDVVSIDVMAVNVDAQRLYRKLGFRPHRVELEKQTETTNHSSENE